MKVTDEMVAAINRTLQESGHFLKFFEGALEGYTYLEETEAKEEY